jgi:hypothetical protein
MRSRCGLLVAALDRVVVLFAVGCAVAVAVCGVVAVAVCGAVVVAVCGVVAVAVCGVVAVAVCGRCPVTELPDPFTELPGAVVTKTHRQQSRTQ